MTRRPSARAVLGGAVAMSCLAAVFCAPATALFADDAALILAPQELFAGGRSAFTLTTLDSTTRSPIDRNAKVILVAADGRVLATLFEGPTGADGRERVEFAVPAVDDGTYRIVTNVNGTAAPLEISTRISAAPAILIETDKPIYKPGQKIQGRVVLLDNTLRPISGQVELAIHDGKGIRVDRRTLSAGEFGAAAFELDVAREVNYGTWRLKATSGDIESIRDIRVEEYVLPRFDLGVEFAKSWALVDENVSGRIEARYFFGKDVDGTVAIRAKRWVADWEIYATSSGELVDGVFEFSLPPVGFVAGTPTASGQGEVTLEVDVIDSTGYEQSTTEILTIVEAPIVLGIVPRSRTIKPQIPLDILVTARTPDGVPSDADVSLEAHWYRIWGESLGKVTEIVGVRGGLGSVSFTPPEFADYAEIRAKASVEGKTANASVRLDGSYSEGHAYISLARVGPEDPVAVGAVVPFQAVATHPGTLYYEVYAGGRTVLSGYSETSDFSFTASPEMAPKARVVAYKIHPDNEVSADSRTIEVEIPTTLRVDARFASESVAPGETVRVSLDAGTGERTLLGVSVVDASVLALGRSRLHLAEVFAELEKRFLEPQIEVHEDNGGGGGPAPGGIPIADGDVGFAGGFARGPRTEGALDVFRGAGLAVAATANLTVRAGLADDWWRWAEDAAGPPVPVAEPGAGGGDPSAPSAVRVRQYFPETWVWEPLLITDENGLAALELTAPDSITNWKLAVIGTGPSGIGFGETELTVFQEFFVEPALPYSVTRGEEFPIKVDVFNYAENAQSVVVSFEDADWLELLGERQGRVSVPAGSAATLEFPIRPTRVGEFEVEITATGSTRADAVRRTLIVVPEGVPQEIVENGIIEAGTEVRLTPAAPFGVVEDSEHCWLSVTPSPVAQTLQGVSDLLGMPYGCGEQNMIFLAPDIEILKYLREIGELSPEIRATAEYYVNVGYQQELTFQTADGGFAAFGGEEGSLWLTAFVLSTFSGARDVRDIDESVLARAGAMLVSRQNADGSFRTDNFLIHTEMDGGLENARAMTAYVTKALAEYADGGTASAEVVASLAKAAAHLRDGWTSVRDDAYSLSIIANALLSTPGYESAGEAVVDRLLELAKDDGPGIHWEPYPVETTGYVALALLAASGGVGRPQAGEAVNWLTTQRNSLGGYGESTQDTVVAIRALFAAARKVNRDLDARLELVSGSETLWSIDIDVSNFDILHRVEIPCAGTLGTELILRSSGTGTVGYQVATRFHIAASELPPPRDVTIEVDYDTSDIEVDEKVRVVVKLAYSGAKERTGMVIADIGVPTGFEVERSTLDALVEADRISRFDLAGRKVILYLDELVRDTPVELSFEIRALYPVRAEGPVSRVYEYYDTKVEAFHRVSGDIEVKGSTITPSEFIRGDANSDQVVNISDPVATLTFLFVAAGEVALSCDDAADTNDDGSLDLSDAVTTLNYLFLGGVAPPAPFPAKGTDPTEDSLGCAGPR
jgi:CD109 antigen